MVLGAIVLTVYGTWSSWVRLPADLSAATQAATLAWAIGLFACVGAMIGLSAALLGLLAGRCVAAPRRPVLAAIAEALLLTALFIWLLLNELLVAMTSEVLGLRSLTLLYHNPAAVMENAWAMGGRYLVVTGLAAGMVCAAVYRLSVRSFRRAHGEHAEFGRRPAWASPRLAGVLSGGCALLAVLVGWQMMGRPSKAFAVLLRSAPPLRALDLSRRVLGDPLAGPAPTDFGPPLITDADYVASFAEPRRPAPNVVYILLESTPAKALHCYGYPKTDITPNLDALAADGVLFEHCLGTASFSSCGLTSIATSLYMLRGPQFDYFANTSFPLVTLPRALKWAGYQLTLFSSGNEAFDNINSIIPPADFEVYFSHDTSDIHKTDSMRMDDRYAVERFEAWLGQRNDDRPFYSGFYLQSPHFNYEVPEPWFSHDLPVPPVFSNGDGILHIPPDVLPRLRNQYDNALRYADHWVGRIVAAVEQAGELDRTIFVVTGDHGEAFMEHGLARHGTHTWEEMIHIPLIIHVGPAVRAALPYTLPSRVVGTVSGIDVAPTVAALAGLPPHPSWQGLNVLDPAYTGHNQPVFSMTQYTRWQEVACLNRIKYICDLSDACEYLFDLSTDPGEKHNLVAERPALAAAMRALLSGWHMHQLSYYDPANRPFTHYIGRYEPSPDLLARIAAALN